MDALSRQLQPLTVVTHNLPPFITEPAVALIGQECFVTLVWNLDLRDAACLKLALSKALGLGMVAGGAILKLPQILTVLRSGSARGLSLTSYVLDTVATGITVAYNIRNGFPFSTYGEMGFLLVQNAILIVLITSFSSRPTFSRLAPLVMLLGSIAYALASETLVPASTLAFLQTLTIPLSLSSKVPQIVANQQARSTGQLSTFLVVNSLAGCLARVFTTLSETQDPLLLWTFALSALLNGVILAQMIVYRGNKSPAPKSRTAPAPATAAVLGEKLSAVKEKVQEVTAQAVETEQPHHGQSSPAPAPAVSTPRRNPAAGAAAAGGSGGPGSAGRRYVRKLD